MLLAACDFLPLSVCTADEELNLAEPLAKVMAAWPASDGPSKITIRRRQENVVRGPDRFLRAMGGRPQSIA